MTQISNFTPEQRVQLFVGGRFTPDTFGPKAFRQIKDAIAAAPDAHLDAFERLYLGAPPSREAITELHLVDFLLAMHPHRRQRVDALARRLDAMMASLARVQAGEAESFADGPENASNEIARQRRQIERRRAGLSVLLGKA